MDIEAFRRDGALRIAGLFDAARLKALDIFEVAGPGVRLQDARLETAIAPATAAATTLLGAVARPVRAVLFDKTPEANWLVAWHQDRTIPVRERRDAPGYGPWSRKGGILHVMPPVGVLERMVTLRIHIDPVGPDNAPLRAALGSHGIGLVPAAEAAATAERLPQIVCLATPGDVWAYSTPILHASDRAAAPTRRRVSRSTMLWTICLTAWNGAACPDPTPLTPPPNRRVWSPWQRKPSTSSSPTSPGVGSR